MKQFVVLFTLSLLFVLGSTQTFAQKQDVEGVKKSVEKFYLNYLSFYQAEQADSLLAYMLPDAFVLGGTEFVVKDKLGERLTGTFNTFNCSDFSVDTIVVEVLSPTEAIVYSTSYWLWESASKRPYSYYVSQTIPLSKQKGKWMLRSIVQHNLYGPIIISKDVGRPSKKYMHDGNDKFSMASYMFYGMLLNSIQVNKQLGVSNDKFFELLGVGYAKTWDKTKSFADNSAGFVSSIQAFSPYVQVIKWTDDEIVFRTYKRYTKWALDRFGVTDEDVVKAWSTTESAISQELGYNYSCVNDGDYMIETYSVKK